MKQQQPSRILPSDKDSDAAGEADDDNAEADDGDAELMNAQNTTNGDGRCTTNNDERDRCEASARKRKAPAAMEG
ncbi:hypothetical protein PIB30_007015 [Stylosanthes scabra]|uniref:Uncharacterized protein n=1 Tax=Stylosanthes scabra TaxID=79078 RepID=A0ABU6Z503_9FABA|nr:hypothetical protein [Stylosanthes scabra]